MEEQTRKRRRGWVIAGLSVVLACVAVLTAFCAVQIMQDKEYHRTHFEEGTFIQGVDCSDLTVEEAKERIEEKEVELRFNDGHSIFVSGKEIGRELDTVELKSFLAQQRSEGTKEFTLSRMSFFVDDTKMRSYLSSLDELKAKNMHEAENAYMYIGEDGLIKISDEVYANVIDFGGACVLAWRELLRGENTILFPLATDSEPEVTASDLHDAAEEVNTALQTEIEFELRDGSFFTLNYSVMKDWLYEDDEGIYHLAIDENLPDFLKSLNRQVRNLCTSMEFTTVEGKTISVPVFGENRDTVDINAELVKIKEELASGGSYEREPIYSRFNKMDRHSTYVEVDKENQNVRVYENGVLTKIGDCVTGDVATGKDTPVGVYYIWYKCTNWDFGYGHVSDYWMPLVSGNEIGLHDAPWRYGVFGGTIYKYNGSDGCINLPDEIAAYIFYNIGLDVPIIIH